MSEAATTTMKNTQPANRIWLLAPLVIFALVSLTIGLLARHTADLVARQHCTGTGIYQTCTGTTFKFFLSDAVVIQIKVWLATGAIILGLFQLLTAARVYNRLHFPPLGRFWGRMHRASGWLAIALTLPIAYHCIFLLGFETINARVLIHSLLGTMFYGTFLGKVWIVRAKGFPGWALPVAGSTVFTLLLGLWLTSGLWFFTRYTL